MKIFRNFIAISFAMFAFSFMAVNAQGLSVLRAENPLEQQVHKKILRLPYYEVFDHIGFKIDGETVTLFGKVRNARNKNDAESYVEDVPGISTVVNNIEVLPLSNFDERIRRDLYRQISNTGALSRYLWTVNPPVRLIVDGGHVTLEGFVASSGDANTMNIVAHGVSGAFSVTNNLVVNRDMAR